MHESVTAILTDYPEVIQAPVFWGDMDSMKHVNNTVYFRWFEEARIRILEPLAESTNLRAKKIGPILAHVGCNFRRQTHFPDTVHIGSRIEKIGNSSLQIRHLIASESQRAVVADGEATIVLFNYAAGKSEPIPDELRAMLAKMMRS